MGFRAIYIYIYIYIYIIIVPRILFCSFHFSFLELHQPQRLSELQQCVKFPYGFLFLMWLSQWMLCTVIECFENRVLDYPYHSVQPIWFYVWCSRGIMRISDDCTNACLSGKVAALHLLNSNVKACICNHCGKYCSRLAWYIFSLTDTHVITLLFWHTCLPISMWSRLSITGNIGSRWHLLPDIAHHI